MGIGLLQYSLEGIDNIFESWFFLGNVECTMSFSSGPLGALKKQKRLFYAN